MTARLAAIVLAGLFAAGPAWSGDAPAATTSSAGDDRYEKDWVYRVRPWKREPVTAVTIDTQGQGDAQRDPTGDPEPCTGFRLSERDVRDFVARGKPVSQRDFLHETTWSACYAVGSVRLGSGTEAQWMIQRYGAGYLTIGGRRHYFDCEQCRFVVAQSK